MKEIRMAIFILISILLGYFSSVQAEQRFPWGSSLVLCADNSNQHYPKLVLSNSSSTITFWTDARTINTGIYAQKVDENGIIQWAEDGLEFFAPSAHTHHVNYYDVISDDDDGAIIAWFENLEDTLFIQRIDEDGDYQWTEPGIFVTENCANAPDAIRLVSEGNGGAIIVWLQFNPTKISAQKYDASGVAQWGGGVTVCDTSGMSYTTIDAVADDSGGVIVGWFDSRNTSDYNLFVQHINSNGTVQFTDQGVCLSNRSGDDSSLDICTDNSGGAIVVWQNNGEIYTQKILNDGDIEWDINGVNVSTTTTYNSNPGICSDLNSGAIIVYTSSNNNYVVKCSSSNGSVIWNEEPCESSNNEYFPNIISDGNGGAFVAFSRWVNQNYPLEDYFIIGGQWLDSGGNRKWGDYGLQIDDTGDSNNQYRSIISDGGWGLVLSWMKDSGADTDICSQKILQVPECELSINSDEWINVLLACPAGDTDNNDAEELEIEIVFDANTMLTDAHSSEITLVKPSSVATIYHNQDNICADSDATNPGYTTTITNKYMGLDDGCVTNNCPEMNIEVRFRGDSIGVTEEFGFRSPDLNGDHHVDLSDLGIYGLSHNRLLGQQGYDCWCDYNGDDAVDLSDFVISGFHYQCAKPDGYYAFNPEESSNSNINVLLSQELLQSELGYILSVTIYLNEVEDISTMCFGIKYNEIGLIFKSWKQYPYYPATVEVAPISRDGDLILFGASFKMDEIKESSVQLGVIEFEIISTNDSDLEILFVDILDVHDEIVRIESVEVDEANSQEVPIYKYNLYPNVPNPFNPYTRITYSIARDEHVSLAIYDVSGRIVRVLIDEVQAKNDYSVVWDGKNNNGINVVSGVYFLRMYTEHYSRTRKLLLLR